MLNWPQNKLKMLHPHQQGGGQRNVGTSESFLESVVSNKCCADAWVRQAKDAGNVETTTETRGISGD